MTRSDDILAAYDRMVEQVNLAYQQAREAMARNDLVEAQNILARIGRVHAKNSVSLRGVLIRRGLVNGDE